MQITTLNQRVQEFNNEFSSFELDKKMMILKITALKEECTSTISEIEQKEKQLAKEKSDAQTRISELDSMLNKI